ncbi:MAG TPA: pitrilysin family protein [Longimicrobiales bacterium]
MRAARVVAAAFAVVLSACTAAPPAHAPAPDAAGAEGRGSPAVGRAADRVGSGADAALPPVGRAAAAALEFRPLRFDPPRPERFELSNGVPVFYLHDPSLPVVELIADFKGGYPHFDRDHYAAATAIGPLMLSGGTASLPPDSVDELVEYYALAPSFGSAGAVTFSSITTLRRNFDVALDLWTEMMRRPRFDPQRVEVWRQRELDTVRRLRDLPNTIAIRAFNRLMYGDHPSGWILNESDLTPAHLAPERLRRVHREVFCADNLVLGVAGDIARDTLRSKLEAAFGDWPACPRKIGAIAPPPVRKEGGVLVIHKELEQSTIVLGQAGGVSKADRDAYHASQIANWILGGGGFSSRLMSRLRTEEGLAYQAWSVWVAGRETERVFGAFTQTKPETTIAAARRVREVVAGMREAPPAHAEVRLAIDNISNGFVFAFETPAQVVSRQMSYLLGGLPEDWLVGYLDGIQAVTPEAVHEVVRRHLRPEDFTVVIVGDTTRFDAAPDVLGPRIPR